jgi:hypothetical protein
MRLAVSRSNPAVFAGRRSFQRHAASALLDTPDGDDGSDLGAVAQSFGDRDFDDWRF